MCANCFTRLDAVALQSVAVTAAAAGGWRRLQARRRGWSWAERQREARERTARFLRDLDLDPDAVLGPPPA